MPKTPNKPNLQQRPKGLAVKTTFSNFSLLVYALLFAAVGGYILWHSFAAPTPPTVYLSPASQTLPASTSFSVQVRENSGTTTVNAVQANFSYNASLVDFVSIDTTGTAFTTDAPSSGGSGTVSIARGIIGSLTGDQLVATVNFKTKTTGGSTAMAFTSGTALVSSTTNQDILGGLAATAGGTYTIDTAPPTVTVTAPANGATLAGGSTSNITVTATDNDKVSSVDIYIDAVKVNTISGTGPYSYSWNTTGLSLGSHTIQARATDPSGNVGTSALSTVTLADQTPPTVTITAPTAGTILKGTASVTVTAADNAGGTGISKVEFYVDGVLKLTDLATPYNFSWDTTTATNASHSLTAKAYDAATPVNSATSAAVSVTVDNSPPTTPGSLRTTGNTLTSIALAWNASTDNAGVTGYRLTRNGTTVTTTSGTTLTYNDTGLSPTTSYNYSLVALDAAGNTSAAATLTASTLTSKPGDLNGDNAVNVTDLSILLSNWGTANATADINKDGIVNIFDLSILLSNYGT